MDVTGSRKDQIPTLVSNEDQQKLSKCDKQMMVQCNENFQRPSWLKGNTKASSWPVPKTERDYSCTDKENLDPRQPFKNIFNTQNQFRQRQSSSPKKDSPSRRKWCQKVEIPSTTTSAFPTTDKDIELIKCEMSTEMREDGYENILNEDLVLDGGDEDMLPVEALNVNTLTESPAGLVKGVQTSGSPTIMSSLLSRRVVINNANEVLSALNLLNNENGASPMLSTVLTQSGANCNRSHGNGSHKETFNGFRRCTSMIDQRQSPPIRNIPNCFNSTDDFTSPISRSNSGGQSSGFKRPLELRKPDNFSTESSHQGPFIVQDQGQDPCIEDYTLATSLPKEQNLRNDGSSKRRRWDVSKCRPMLLKSHSMSAIDEESPTGNEESSNRVSYLIRGQKNSGRKGVRLSRSKSTMDPAAAAQIMEACSLAEFDPNRTGDTRRQLSLPITQGHAKNEDLKNIDCHIMAKVLNGELDDIVARFRIIDARYCYEYEGGHIRGAENYGSWDEEAFLAEFFPPSLEAKMLTPKQKKSIEDQIDGGGEKDSKENERREILVFHCEFSSARGPALMRMLRKKDREINKATYPALHYPECYLLHEGYKAFYEAYPNLCDGSYLPMKHPSFVSEERKFHKKSKSWAAGGGGTVSRTGASSRLLKL